VPIQVRRNHLACSSRPRRAVLQALPKVYSGLPQRRALINVPRPRSMRCLGIAATVGLYYRLVASGARIGASVEICNWCARVDLFF
jgi:hypothetical protein